MLKDTGKTEDQPSLASLLEACGVKLSLAQQKDVLQMLEAAMEVRSGHFGGVSSNY
jgi:hypothetical protein